MIAGSSLDVPVIDRTVTRASEAGARAAASLSTKDGREAARVGTPFDVARDASTQSTFRALRDHEASPLFAQHRDGLVRWVHELLQARVGWDLTVDEADAIHALDPALEARPALARAAEDGREPGDFASTLVSFDRARRALVSATDPKATEIALGRLTALAPPVAAVRRELRARRFEVARRLDLDHPWALATPWKPSELVTVARSLLDRTEPLAVELRKAAARREPAQRPLALGIHGAFARNVAEGWPAHLNARWLEETFRAIVPRAVRVVVPPAVGGASFVRAAYHWGFAVRLAGTPKTLPFALARDPYPVDAHLFGSTFAGVVAQPAFARRKLGLGARGADAHRRGLGPTLLWELRANAASFIAGASSRGDELEELTARVFGVPLDARLAEAWALGGFSGASRIDAPARFIAGLGAHGFLRALVDRFDEDWFDNPRVASHLAGIGAGPVWRYEEGEAAAMLSAVEVVARAFEEALG